MIEDEHLAEIVAIHPDRDLQDEEAPIHADPKTYDPCAHKFVRLDRVSHRVYCRSCDTEVDPFTVLAKLAGDWAHYVRHRDEAKRRAVAASTRLEEILRLERNARSRLKKLDPRQKPPERPWGEGSL